MSSEKAVLRILASAFGGRAVGTDLVGLHVGVAEELLGACSVWPLAARQVANGWRRSWNRTAQAASSTDGLELLGDLGPSSGVPVCGSGKTRSRRGRTPTPHPYHYADPAWEGPTFPCHGPGQLTLRRGQHLYVNQYTATAACKRAIRANLARKRSSIAPLGSSPATRCVQCPGHGFSRPSSCAHGRSCGSYDQRQTVPIWYPEIIFRLPYLTQKC